MIQDTGIILSWTGKKKKTRAVSIYIHSIFSFSGATETDKLKSSARDRLSLHSSVLPPTLVQPLSSPDHLIEDFLPRFFFVRITNHSF